MMKKLEGELVRKVPIFFGFKPTEMRAFLEVCKLSSRPVGEVICEFNTASNRLFILMDGELEVLGKDGGVLAAMHPVTTVGEMGFVSRRPRSATVRVSAPSRLLKVEYHDFEAICEREPEMRAKIFRNMVRILYDRLSDSNDMVTRFRKLYEAARDGREAPGEEGQARVGEESVAPVEAREAQPLEEAGPEKLLHTFYELAGISIEQAPFAEDRDTILALRRDGYSEADIEYAIKWAVRNLPAVRRFSLVKMSIEEAFEEKWSL